MNDKAIFQAIERLAVLYPKNDNDIWVRQEHNAPLSYVATTQEPGKFNSIFGRGSTPDLAIDALVAKFGTEAEARSRRIAELRAEIAQLEA